MNYMENVLKIYTFVDGINDIPFPESSNHIEICEKSFSASRMATSPNLTAKVSHSYCLDNLWTGKEYVVFRGERYFIRDTPSSSKSNTDSRYVHELTFKSERVDLDNTYFFDVVSPDAPDVDKYVSNSTNVVFFGDIHEFADRLNYSLAYSKLSYVVIVDSGITSEAKLMSFQDKFFSEVLTDVFNVFEIPYYYSGKEIHIGFTENAIPYVFKYGIENSLLSIDKTNANFRIINRATGIGSTTNIPYYYPNETSKGVVGAYAAPSNASIGSGDIQVVNKIQFSEKVKTTDKVIFKTGLIKNNSYGALFYLKNTRYEPGQSILGRTLDIGQALRVPIDKLLPGYKMNAEILFTIEVKTRSYFDIIIRSGTSQPMFDSTVSSQMKIYENNTFVTYNKKYLDPGTYIFSTLLYAHTFSSFMVGPPPPDTGTIWVASYEISQFSDSWTINNKRIELSDIGVSINKAPSNEDYFTQNIIKYITPSKNLMPSIYRETNGAERFYNALNNTYISPQTGSYYQFENEYTDGNSKEIIVSFDDIKPSIKEMTNAAGLRIDEILAVAFDDDDNDEIKESDGNLLHPYFYVKLRKMDGANGFNLFDQGIATGEMTISMTSGNCAACNFVIGVEEKIENSNIFENSVQVDSNGNIVKGNFAEKVNANNIQPEQQNTQLKEVWIAVSKDIETFPDIMPNHNFNYKPTSGDSFVLLNITMPQGYVTNAENKLKEEIIKYMAINNTEKFNFSITFSRIFFAENPDILEKINENARVRIEYNREIYELYVSNFDYRMGEKDSLPEIKIELVDEITASKGALQNSIDSVKQDIMSSVGSIDFFKQGLKYFIRKDVPDIAGYEIVFEDGIYVKKKNNVANSIQEDRNSIQEEGNAIQEYSVEAPISDIPSDISLGDLSNVNPIVDQTTIKDVILVKKAGSAEWTQMDNSVSSSDPIIKKKIIVNADKVGHVLKGKIFEDKTLIESILRSILYKSEPATFIGRISISNDVEIGTSRGTITYTINQNDNGNLARSYYIDNLSSGNPEVNLSYGSPNANGDRVASRVMSGYMTVTETYLAYANFLANAELELPAITLDNRISVNPRRRWFSGTPATVPETSDSVRAMPSSGLLTSLTFSFNIKRGSKNVMFCIPDTYALSKIVYDGVVSGLVVTNQFTARAVNSVYGANSQSPVGYKCYYKINDIEDIEEANDKYTINLTT